MSTNDNKLDFASVSHHVVATLVLTVGNIPLVRRRCGGGGGGLQMELLTRFKLRLANIVDRGLG